MTDQTRGFSYTVTYGKYSSNSSSYHPDECRPFNNIEEAKYFGIQEIIRLGSLGEKIIDFDVTEFCLNCDGKGVVYVPYKRIKFRKKEIKCPICKGKDSEVRRI